MRKSLTTLFLTSIVILLISSCTEPQIPQGYALLYGIEAYGPGNNLNYCIDDAEALGELLTDKGWIVTVRTDSDADLPGLTADVESLKQTMNKDDRFLFYFSGHGVQIEFDSSSEPDSTDNLEEVLVLSGALTAIFDFEPGDASADIESVTVTDDSLAILLSELPTENKTVIIDACFSGGFIGNGFTFSNILPDYTLNESAAAFAPIESMKLYSGYATNGTDLTQSDFAVLTASGADEESFETSTLNHGIFTYFLLKTSANADFNSDGYISLSEAWSYISFSIDSFWNESEYVSTTQHYMTNIAAFPVDPVLFKAD